MAIGFMRSDGTDFDSIFAPWVQGTPNYTGGLLDAAANDIGGRYAPIAFGSKAADVGYMISDGRDVSNLWAAAGTAVYSLPINGRFYQAGYGAPTNQTGNAFATLSFQVLNNGVYQIYRSTRGGGNAALDSGNWNTFGFAVDVRLIQTGDQPVDTGYVDTGTSRSVNLTANVPSASGEFQEVNSNVQCIFSRSGQGDAGRVSTTTVGFSCSANGWV